jgi:hypothetical protein
MSDDDTTLPVNHRASRDGGALAVGEHDICSSGGGTRTHNLRINSPPLCQLSYPGVSPGSLPTASDWTRLRVCGSEPVSWWEG